jgi:hypothetical protein
MTTYKIGDTFTLTPPRPTMNADRYRQLLAVLGLTQNDAARFFGVRDSRKARRWGEGEAIPATVAMLLEIMAAYSITPNHAERLGTGNDAGDDYLDRYDAMLDKILEAYPALARADAIQMLKQAGY